MGDAIDKIGQAQQGVSEIITVENTADMIEELAGMQAIQFTPTGSNLTEYGNALNDTMSASSRVYCWPTCGPSTARSPWCGTVSRL